MLSASLLAFTSLTVVPSIAIAGEPSDLGTVSGAITLTPETDPAEVTVYATDATSGEWGARHYGSVEADGAYTIHGLPAGAYKVGVTAFDANFVTQWYPSVPTFDQASALTVEAGATVTGIDFILVEGGQISGIITSEGGEAVSGVGIMAQEASAEFGSQSYSGVVQEDGTYLIQALPAGSYKVQVATYDTNFIRQWYSGAYSFTDAQAIEVGLGDAVDGIDFSLTAGGEIRGTITAAGSGGSVGRASVTAYSVTDHTVNYQGWASEDGSYGIPALPAGSYKVQAQASTENFLPGWHGGVGTYATANTIEVVLGQVVANVDISLHQGSQISGTIRDENGEPVSSGVTVYTDRGGIGFPDENGEYTIAGLEAGTYKIQVTTHGSNFVGQWYSGAPSRDEALPVTVGVADSKTGIDFTLAVGGQISGRVLSEAGEAISGVRVVAYDSLGQQIGQSAQVDSSGVYSMRGLPAGAYRLYASTQGPTNSLFTGEWHSNAASFTEATPIEVVVGGETLVDFELELGASIAGRVTEASSGKALSGIAVTAYPAPNPNEFEWATTSIRKTTTDATGRFEIVGLAPGEYKVFFEETGADTSYLRSWWGGEQTFEAAESITLASGDAKAAVNAQMTPVGVRQPAAAPVVSFDGQSDGAAKFSWTKPESAEPIIAYTLSLAYGAGGDGAYVVGGDTLSFDFDSIGWSPVGAASWFVSVAAVTASSIGHFGSVVGNFPGPDPFAPAPQIDLVDATTTSLTFEARLYEPLSSSGDIWWYAALVGDSNVSWPKERFSYATSSLSEVIEFTELIPGQSYSIYVAAGVSGSTDQTMWGSLLNQSTLSLFDSAPTPTIEGAGEPQSGTQLVALPGAWEPAPVELSYEWRAEGTAVGTNAATYTPTAADVGKTITVTVTGSKPGYVTESKTSAATAEVVAAPPPVDPEPPVVDPESKTTPVYRFWSEEYQGHFYTASAAERDRIIANYPSHVWQYENVAFSAFATQQPGTVPVFRFWSETYRGHFFTASVAERDKVIAQYDDSVWLYENIAYYVHPSTSNATGTKPVYRFWSDTYRHHFYTSSEAEKNKVIANYPSHIWKYENVAYRVPS